MGHTQCTRCEKFCDQVKKIWGAFSEKENQLRFPKPCIVVRKTDVLVCKWMIDLNVFKGIKPDWAEVNWCKLICAGFFSWISSRIWKLLDIFMYLKRVPVHAITCTCCSNDQVIFQCCILFVIWYSNYACAWYFVCMHGCVDICIHSTCNSSVIDVKICVAH